MASHIKLGKKYVGSGKPVLAAETLPESLEFFKRLGTSPDQFG